MKNAVVVLVLILLALGAEAQVHIGPAQIGGWSSQPTVIEFANATPLKCEVVAYTAAFSLLPGEAKRDTRHFQAVDGEMPVAALCYAMSKEEEYVGRFLRKYYISANYPSLVTVEIRLEDLVGPDGYSAVSSWWKQRFPHPDPPPMGADRVKVPRPRPATLTIQVVNNTTFGMVVKATTIDGFLNSRVGTAMKSVEGRGVVAFDLWNSGAQDVETSVIVELYDRGRLVGTRLLRVYVPATISTAQQLAVDVGPSPNFGLNWNF